jgi:hypothetical protein
MEEPFMGKYKIEMVNEYKVLPPMDEKAVEATINSYAIDGWKVFVFSRIADGEYYALMFRVKQKELKPKG